MLWSKHLGNKTRRELLLKAAEGSALWAATGRLEASAAETPAWTVDVSGYSFRWDIENDRATLQPQSGGTPIWAGGLLPSFLLMDSRKNLRYVQPTVDQAKSSIRYSGGTLRLLFGQLATGEVTFVSKDFGLEFTRFELEWQDEAQPIVGLYFGASALLEAERLAAPVLDQKFWPNWEFSCLCVPGAKGAPLQSVFRNWDLGNATLPLGSFGPSLGTPYAAAYPRPLYAAAMGGQQGWVCVGSGSVPDAPLSLMLGSSSACFHSLYREDLWGALRGKRRTWEAPLRLAWAQDPWRAYQRLFSSFPRRSTIRATPIQPHWNSWGDFKKNVYELRGLADWTSAIGAGVVCLDDRWESFVGSGEPARQRFPRFDADIQYIKSKGLNIGFWQPIGWVDQPQAVGLNREDLIVGLDGEPRRASWNTNPRAGRHYCLDPSSSQSVQFLRRRTRALMEKYRPVLLKLDFGYGLPSPNTGVPRDPALRGERFSLRLVEIIAEAARSVDKEVAIEYYSLHPLWRDVVDVVALDDLGDAGNQEAAGHKQWSIWAALAAEGSTIMASSGYDWNSDSEVILNSAVIGVPGAVLSRTMDDGSPVPEQFLNRRLALNRWYRRTTAWSPLWLNSSPGGYLEDPVMRCFGRMESIRGEDRLTALVLREEEKRLLPADALKGAAWTGSWALIAQDDEDIFRSRRLICLPMEATEVQIARPQKPARVTEVCRSRVADSRDWTWSNGTLRLNAKQKPADLLALLVEA